MTSKELLKVNNLKVYYRSPAGKVKAVDGVSFTLGENEVLGIVGESGCGKSTLATAILKLIRPPCYVEDGEVIFNGKNLLKLEGEDLRRIRWKELSYIPQGSMNSLNPVMKIGDQIVDAMMAHTEISKEEAKEKARKLLESVGLPSETINMYPHELSGGMKQRVIIAIATALEPKLIVADEFTTALDVLVQRKVIEFLEERRASIGASMINITHDIAVQAVLVHKLAVMYAGKIVELSDVYTIFEEPLHPYTKGLIMATPVLGEKKVIKGIPGNPPNLLNPPPGCRFYPRCTIAEDKCKHKSPPLMKVEEDRYVACWKYGGE
ncbi:MAG TPA: ABC transporter ATP-binding protein [Candidatus Bathyarchaeota archaeon]|nr:ABC transporter ATP-binding protein [Candidatus Bathyarchaeota archaeon]